MYPETFEGFAVTDTSKWSTVSKIEFKPKPFEDYDVDVRILACGVCGSDVHTVKGGWSQPMLPVIPGHEIIGEVIKVGDKVSTVKVGDRVGVGAQIYSCLDCETCKEDHENYCPKRVGTYNSLYADGTVTYGGYSSHIRAHEYFVFPIPDGLKTEDAAPMLCAGITTYAPLVENGCGPGKKVGIVGIGGLGHFAIMFAKALGAEVYTFSRTSKKAEDAKKLGSNHYIATYEEKDWAQKYAKKLDLIVSCGNSAQNFDLAGYLSCLKVHGKMISVGLPEEPFTVSAMPFMRGGVFFGSSHLGNRPQMLDMLKLAAEKNLVAWTERLPVSESGIKEALERCHSGDVRYRFVLTDYDKFHA
ncbi:hypothetical protein KL941_003686 [Ogataea angusta]|nr:hypothetical protein KL941_003686 [Ogataea angusta]